MSPPFDLIADFNANFILTPKKSLVNHLILLELPDLSF
jgi:hypothetical protein